MNLIRSLCLAVALSLAPPAAAWVSPYAGAGRASTSSRLQMAIDYNDPVVAEEFTQVQPMAFEDVEEELMKSGIRVPPTMNDMEAKLMLVEMRLRFSGKLGGRPEKKRPDKFSSKFEEAIWTKPAFDEFYDTLKANGDPNALNVVAEYVNSPDVALQRYGKDYRGLIRQAEQALTAPPPVKSSKLAFSGFPANMGEDACRMTLEALGEVVEFDCAPDEDFPILTGTIEYADIESAKAAVAQYNGMDMGMGTALSLKSV
ncbi:expressed unknown protein [Seminavis robusta]|uniref:RRM domain-containing protein n=1 Tax=Seminavis robusta TaxID=568900 RepID=A0A9N8DHP6_9STRA|nr:expressed unknown protein [Seminavis robusta]|eukprot:Sro151_g069110.1 n/a (258) ;mRNA; f:37592-38621